MTTVVGIVLAAGSALRMGEPKQLLPYRGSTLLNVVIANAEASRLDHIVVVTGANAQAVEDSIVAERATVVFNPDFQLPNMASVVCGARSVNGDAFVTLPADMPGISAEVINAVIDWWEAQSPWAAMASYLDRAGHPFLLSRAALDEAAEVAGPKVLWRMLSYEGSGRVTRVTVAETAPRDINTPQDYEAFLADG